MRKQRINQSGIAHLGLFLLLIVIAVVGFAGWRVYSSNKDTNKNETTNSSGQAESSDSVTWEYINDEWKPSGTPPKCSDPLLVVSPVDVSKASAILYPGQTRGQYKPHGGFRFDNAADNSVEVKLAIDAVVVEGARYIEGGQVQYMFDFINSCGIRLRYDHLLTLSPAFQKLADTLPEPKVDDSRTTKFNNGQSFKAGEAIATEIGFSKPKLNVGMDFGVYDLRQPNDASKNSDYAAEHSMFKRTEFYAICWLNDLPGKDAATVLALPAGDSKAGKTSDYCE